MLIRFMAVSLLIWALALPAAAEVGLPHTFFPDTPALASEVNENFRYVAPKHVVYVSGEGSPEENGAALVAATKSSSLAAIAGAPSEANPYLLKVMPGTFAVSETLDLPSHVHLVGAGRLATRIRSSAAGVAIALRQGTLQGFSLSLLNDAASEVVGIKVSSAPKAQISSVDIDGIGKSVWGLQVEGGATRVDHLTIQLEVTNAARGISVSGSGSLFIRHSRVALSGEAKVMTGFSETGAITVEATDLFLSLVNNERSPTSVHGIFSAGSGRKQFTSSQVDVFGQVDGVTYPVVSSSNSGGVLTYQNGWLNKRAESAHILRIEGGTALIRIAGSRLSSGIYSQARTAGATVACIYNYDELLKATSCQADLL